MWEFRDITNQVVFGSGGGVGASSTNKNHQHRRSSLSATEESSKKLHTHSSNRNTKKGFRHFNPCTALMGQSYFAADGDEDGISKRTSSGADAALSWRGDPRETYSDWTIVVTTGDTAAATASDFVEEKTYHVHKSILSVGPRSSKYFAKLFHEQQYHPSQTTKIELDEQDAACFPLMLDFMYNTASAAADLRDDESLSLVVGEDFTTVNAVSLRHLARVFDCEGLMRAVNKFIQVDLSLMTGPVYLAQAYMYQDERLVESAKRLCVEHFAQLDTRHIIRLPLPLFTSLIHSVVDATCTDMSFTKESEEALSYQLSHVVSQYFEKHPQELTIQLLLELTDEAIMPKIASEPAIAFTALARELQNHYHQSSSSESPSPFTPEEWKGLVQLCQRCAKAVVGEYGWKDFNVGSALDEFVYGPCAAAGGGGENNDGKVDALLFATSFAAALERAQGDYKLLLKAAKTKKSSSSSSSFSASDKQQHHQEDARRRIQLLEREKSDLEEENRLQQEDIQRYKTLLDDTKEELLLLRQQVKELRRRNNF
jgi:hypothetical protein